MSKRTEVEDQVSGKRSEKSTAAAASTNSASRPQLQSGDPASASRNERDLRELLEQKRLERQLEEKLALMEKERAGVIAKLWSQIDHRSERNSTTQQRTSAAVSDRLHNSTSTSGLVLPLSDNATSPTDNNSRVNTTIVGPGNGSPTAKNVVVKVGVLLVIRFSKY